MDKPLFERKYWATETKVLPTHISHRILMNPELTIPIKQIASVTLSNRFSPKVTIETSGGKKHNLNLKIADKEAFRDAIYAAMK